MEFKKVVIIGAGAVGCYVLWGLSQKQDIDLSVIASGERKKRIESEGFNINDRLYRPVVKTPAEAHGADLVIVAVKYNALQSAVLDIKEIVDGHTVVMSLMNGVDSEDVIASAIGDEHIIPALIKVASERKQNVVRFDPETTIGIIYGERDGRRSERTAAVGKLFEGTGLNYRETHVILPEIWSKFRLNVGNNLPQAMLSVGVGAYSDSEHVAALREGLVKELEAIAEAKGIDMSLADPTSIRGSKVFKRARYSTLQDLDAKRHTEVDMFSGAIIRMGRELGIPTPYNEFTFHMIKALEEKNDGRFDYEPNIAYYNENADSFFEGSINADMSESRLKFSSHVRPGGRILDAGCGSGRDSKAFMDAGFDVVSFDASEEMRRRASEYIGREVLNLRFEDISFTEEFDGIWASASLLHVPMDELPGVMRKMRRALKEDGVMYASFKYGEGTTVRGERTFSDFNEKSIVPLFEDAGFEILCNDVGPDSRPGRETEMWVSVIAAARG